MNETTDQLDVIKTYDLSDAISIIEASCVDMRNVEDGSDALQIKLIAAATGYSEKATRKARIISSLELINAAVQRIMDLEE